MISLAAFDALIASRSLLLHPFYQWWSRGELTLDDLRVYAREYFHLVQRIPGVVARVRDRMIEQDPALARTIERNVDEEEEHIGLWKRFAQSLGISGEELESHVAAREVQDAVRLLEDVAEEGYDEGASAVYALERELPKIAQTKKEGLCEFYGLRSADAHSYFDEHLGEEKHLRVWLSRPVDPARAKAAVERSMEAQNRVLDAVCEACGISVTC